ncbi:PKD repeat protein [Paenibacillus shirakamiensis]|uniref:PKD repeat protein n=1 Tax=Paenibacillus shirakamiensis TaxID=1265935 RepID=A0ABS4JJQ6_9BACL|nr:copper amine oxidase N-terminal domain-containing protein [Paenibacillus shirakamiensis]MBP2001918.1 PKD repeat protein [Paenibacillus shirakamiensis]
MNLKKATLVTALIISQVAAAVPASAEASVQTSPTSQMGMDTQSSAPTPLSNTSSSISTTPSTTPSKTETSPATGSSSTSTNSSTPSSGSGAKDTTSNPSPTAPSTEAVPGVTQTKPTKPASTPATPVTPGTTETPTDDTKAAGNPKLVTPTTTNTTDASNPVAPAAAAVNGQLILFMDSARMEQNGSIYTATHAMTVKKGVSYVGIRSLVDRVGYKIAYDSRTKETLITYGGNELRFKRGSSIYRVNGVSKTMRGAAYEDKNVFLVPLTAITQALGIPYTVSGKRVILQLSTKPSASFTVQSGDITAGETRVNFQTKSFSPNGLQIVNEKWEGRPDQDIFPSAGSYSVTYSVQDSSGQWSDPYTQTIQVSNPNLPPVAQFATNKSEYKIGEPVTITDQSTDEENAIVDRQWLNNRPAFFTAGPVTISLTVTDKHGATSKIDKTITITNETLYTEDQFYKLFTPVGQNFQINGGNVLNYDKIPFTYTTEPYTLFRDSGPESVTSEGILYQDTIVGLTRFMIHHRNRLGEKAKVYLVAKNTDSTLANIDILSYGVAGPNQHPELTGRLSVQRYFENYQSDSKKQRITLAPGESKVIMNDLSNTSLSQEDCISLLGDLYSDARVQYTVLIVKEKHDPIQAVTTVPYLDPKESIIRGTFADSTRVFEYNEVVGTKEQRLNLTDNTADPFQTGTDGILGTSALNSGNYGVMYKLKLNRVAPNTLITFNPRGGLYMGAAMVNGNVVSFSHTGANNVSNQTSVLYRTKDYEENVEIWLSPSAGSNMPFTLLLMPMPSVKQQP